MGPSCETCMVQGVETDIYLFGQIRGNKSIKFSVPCALSSSASSSLPTLVSPPSLNQEASDYWVLGPVPRGTSHCCHPVLWGRPPLIVWLPKDRQHSFASIHWAEVRDEERAELRDEAQAEVWDEVRAEVRDKVWATNSRDQKGEKDNTFPVIAGNWPSALYLFCFCFSVSPFTRFSSPIYNFILCFTHAVEILETNSSATLM